MSEHRISLRVNGELHELDVPARFTLADALRDRLDLVGTHVGCEQGICGSCTVLIDGEASRSCTVLAVSVDGADVRTVEGLSQGGELSATQQAFADAHGLQCGFCTPGYLMTLEALLSAPQRPTREQMLDALSGVVCRCTGYVGVLEAAEAAINNRYDEAR
jgi:aerobic-type carbon monoxide dehydrogenase small subunit (CoxS/CutS family)